MANDNVAEMNILRVLYKLFTFGKWPKTSGIACIPPPPHDYHSISFHKNVWFTRMKSVEVVAF